MDVATSTDTAARPSSAQGRSRSARLTLATGLLLAVWIGLCAGWLDVGLLLLKKYALNKEGSFRSARDFPWTVPLGHVVLALAAAVVLLGVSRCLPRRLPLRIAAWLLASLALWGALLRMPIHPAASLVLALGTGLLFGDLIAGFGFSLSRPWVRRSLAALLALLVLAFAATTGRYWWRESHALASLPPAHSKAPNVLFIVWDTVRASNLSHYGYHRQTSPNLTRWAEKGVTYDLSLAPAPWTYPSHACFFTGDWPLETDTQWEYTLDTPDPTLAEFLASKGYQTGGFVANTNCCNYETGLDRGFIHFEDYERTPLCLLSRTVPGKWLLERGLIRANPYARKWVSLQSRGASEISGAFLDWLGRRRTDRPFFAFLNYFDAHEPYIPPAGYEARFGVRPEGTEDYQFLVDWVGTSKPSLSKRQLVLAHDCYDDCLAFLDQQLDDLLGKLERQGLLDNTIVILTSDHGEAWGDHWTFGHSYTVHLEEVAVPLVILAPGAPNSQRVLTPISLRDLPATVADLTGLAKDSPFPGRSLTKYWTEASEDGSTRQTSVAFSEQADESAFDPEPAETRGRRGFAMSLVTPDGYQYMRSSKGQELLFYIWKDPRTIKNLIGTHDGDSKLRQTRRMLLDFLDENHGSTVVEKAYLKQFRAELAGIVERKHAKQVAARPRGVSASR